MNKEMVDESKMKEKNIEATEKNEKETKPNFIICINNDSINYFINK